MEPKRTRLPEPFRVAGISVRTSNRDEGVTETAKLGLLWGRFFSGNIADTIPHRVPDSPIYGVYSDYESDVNGRYTTTAGVRVDGSSASSDGEIEAGDYLVFEKKGAMPDIVVETWGEVWRFFDGEGTLRRKYATDFEEYRGPDEVAIHIGVQHIE